VVVILIEPIWETVTPGSSTSTNPSGWRFARSRHSCEIARSSYSVHGASRMVTSLDSRMFPFLAYGETRSFKYTAKVFSSKNSSMSNGAKLSMVSDFKKTTSSPFAFATSA